MNDYYQKDLVLQKAKLLAHKIYKVTRNFPKSELYGLTSQIRRAGVSVPLNLLEGYARFRVKQQVSFCEIAYGSLKEVQFLILFCYEEGLINKINFQEISNLAEEVARMLYSIA